METYILANWKDLTFEPYNGKPNPDEHIDIYIIQVSLYMSNLVQSLPNLYTSNIGNVSYPIGPPHIWPAKCGSG